MNHRIPQSAIAPSFKEKRLASGMRDVTVRLRPGEEIAIARPGRKLIEIRDDAYYGLGEPLLGDVYPSHTLQGVREVEWDPISQKWIE